MTTIFTVKKKAIWFVVILLLQMPLLFLCTSIACADGLKFKGDSLKEEAVTILLTKDQLRTPERTRIELTKEQIGTIKSKTGKVIHWTQYMYLNNAKKTCTCMMKNMGVLYSPRTLKIIVRLLDEKATDDIVTNVKSID